MAEIARGKWEQRGGGGQSAVLQGPASSCGLPEEGEIKEQLKGEQDGSMPRHQVSRDFPERRHEQPGTDAERTLT